MTATPIESLVPIVDEQCTKVGSYELEFIHTPGHSPGSMCIRITNDDDGTDVLITGDTVFPGSCGRLDLPGSDAKIMYDSLQRLAQLPDDLPIFPGHGYGGAQSTIGEEKRSGLLRTSMTRDQWNRQMVR